MTLARTAAAVATVVVLMAGCSTGEVRTATDAPIVELIAQAWDATDDGTGGMVRTEELISQCMHDAGFDYTPVDYTPVDDAEPTAAVEGPEPGTRGFAALYGYGIVLGPEDPDPSVQFWVDPNADYVGALDPAEADAYWAALTGSASPSDARSGEPAQAGSDDDWQYDWRTAGCRGWASRTRCSATRTRPAPTRSPASSASSSGRGSRRPPIRARQPWRPPGRPAWSTPGTPVSTPWPTPSPPSAPR
jgi:hypothetical protein